MYLTYEEYCDMGGTLDSTTFDDFRFKAETIINLYTYNRLKNEEEISESVKRCVFALIKLVCVKSSISPVSSTSENSSIVSGISSQSNDGVSISYNVLSASELSSKYDIEVKSTVSMYLSNERNSLGHRLLFKGLYADE